MSEQKSPGKRKDIGDYFHLLAVPAGMLLLALVIIDVCGRLFFGKNLDFGLTLQELLLMVIGFTSLGATWKAGQFINVDILLTRLSGRLQLALSLLAMLASILCTSILLWFSIEACIRAFAGGARPSNMNMPLGIWKLFIPMALASLFVEITTSLVGKVKHLIAGEARISK
jgi:TRAP-type C4-dicarboxylate transport system permease small subunit